jgi:hypothetical protein
MAGVPLRVEAHKRLFAFFGQRLTMVGLQRVPPSDFSDMPKVFKVTTVVHPLKAVDVAGNDR